MKKNLAIIATSAFLVSIFLPFLTYNGQSVSLSDIIQAAAQYRAYSLDLTAFSLAIILAVIGLIRLFSNKGYRWVLWAGIFGLLACAIEIITGQSQLSEAIADATLLEILGFGFWIMLLSSIGMIVSFFLKTPEPLQSAQYPQPPQLPQDPPQTPPQ
jgi:hypothetical protein